MRDEGRRSKVKTGSSICMEPDRLRRQNRPCSPQTTGACPPRCLHIYVLVRRSSVARPEGSRVSARFKSHRPPGKLCIFVGSYRPWPPRDGFLGRGFFGPHGFMSRPGHSERPPGRVGVRGSLKKPRIKNMTAPLYQHVLADSVAPRIKTLAADWQV